MSNHLSAIYIWFSLFWRKQSRDNPLASARGQDGVGGGGRRDLAIAVLNCVSSKDFLRSLDRLQGS